MTSQLETVTMSHDTSWTWNVLPMLAAALALSVVLFPQGNLPAEEAAAEAAPIEATALVLPWAPSPQPGLGEPELVAANLSQSY